MKPSIVENPADLLISSEAQFALDYTEALDTVDSPDLRVQEEREVLQMVDDLESVEEQLLVLSGLRDRAIDRKKVLAAIEASENLKYGDGIIEIVSLEDLPKAVERMRAGKNPAVVLRAEAWDEDHNRVGDAIPELLAEQGTFVKVGAEKFPKPNMKSGSSFLHLDNFIHARPGETGYKYSFSAAHLDSADGRVMFMGGFASKRARNDSPKVEGVAHPYDLALMRLEEDPRVRKLYESADNGNPKLSSDFVTRDETHIVAAVLDPGDTVLWSQGGPGSEIPAWHAFRKIGDEPRDTTSYHYIKQPSAPQSV